MSAPVAMVLCIAGPNQCATVPDSNSPSSFDVPMKRLLTAETRPRFSLGVSNCTSVCRTTTLTLSDMPQTTSVANESQNQRDNPNAMVARPKMVTAQSSARPAFWSGGRCGSVNEQAMAPMGSAACNNPNPYGPTCKISFA